MTLFQTLLCIVSCVVVTACSSGPTRTESRPAETKDIELDSVAGIPAHNPIDIPWIEGEWGTFYNVDALMTIERVAKGRYRLAAEGGPPAWGGGELRVYEIGCHRVGVLGMATPDQPQSLPNSTLVFRITGFKGRLSLDAIPAPFPMAWSAEPLKEHLGIKGGGEVPPERRIEAIEWMLSLIDERGTFMNQDMSYYRFGDLQEILERIETD